MMMRRSRPFRHVFTALWTAVAFAARGLLGAGTPLVLHENNVLGTSLDLQIVADSDAHAKAASDAILAEIERLRRILSTYDDATDAARLNAAPPGRPVKVAPELIAVLQACEQWTRDTRGAYSAQLGTLLDLWQQGVKAGKLPDASALQAAVRQLPQPGWKIDADTVTRLTDQQLNINSLGKGFIVGRAVQAARDQVPGLKAVLLNIGGDLLAWGEPAPAAAWEIAVANPEQSAENASPLTRLQITDRAVATSGSYERFFLIGGKRYSHILDPRTGQPARQVRSATVIAKDNVTANALATSLCVLGPDDGLRLLRTLEGVECLLVTADGKIVRSPGFAPYELKTPATQPKANPLWPEGYALTIDFTIKPAAGRRPNLRPYVAVWIEDADGKLLRTLELWANRRGLRYLRDMRGWWKFGKDLQDPSVAVTRATRNAGHYSVAWDGLDAQGTPVQPGSYRICLEVCYEDAGDSTGKALIACARKEASAAIDDAACFQAVTLHFGPPAR